MRAVVLAVIALRLILGASCTPKDFVVDLSEIGSLATKEIFTRQDPCQIRVPGSSTCES